MESFLIGCTGLMIVICFVGQFVTKDSRVGTVLTMSAHALMALVLIVLFVGAFIHIATR